MMATKKLDVYYKKQLVGTLAERPNKQIAFQYSADWQKNGFSISPIALPLKNDVFTPPEKNSQIFHGLYGVFADSLPDAWGDLLMQRYFASIGVNLRNLSILDRLAYIGSTGMGALEYYPSKESDYGIIEASMDYDAIAKECNNILDSKTSDQLDLLYKLAGSSGGTRPKILIKESSGEWIVKFPARTDDSICGKREYDYYLCALNCDINISSSELVPSTVCDGYFKTKRFDRVDGAKIFTSTFAALLNVDYNMPTCDYETFFKLVNMLTKENNEDLKHMYKQMCFNVLNHNRDDHTKNFSFIFTEDYGWRLAPAYDITYSTTYYGEQTTSVKGKGKDISDDDLISTGVQAGLKKSYCEEALADIREKSKILDIYQTDRKQAKTKKTKVTKRLNELK